MDKQNYDYLNMYYPYMPYDKKKGMYYGYALSAVQMPYMDENAMDEMDAEYMKRMYNDILKEIQYYVDEECDKMEYDGSYMYDEYPDKEAIANIVEKIYEKLMEEASVTIEEVSSDDVEVEAQQYGYGSRWLKDLIWVMLSNEIFGRRRRYYRRRKDRHYYPRHPYYKPDPYEYYKYKR